MISASDWFPLAQATGSISDGMVPLTEYPIVGAPRLGREPFDTLESTLL